MGAELAAAAAGQIIDRPVLGALAQPALGDHGEVGLAVVPERRQVPHVLVPFGLRVQRRQAAQYHRARPSHRRGDHPPPHLVKAAATAGPVIPLTVPRAVGRLLRGTLPVLFRLMKNWNRFASRVPVIIEWCCSALGNAVRYQLVRTGRGRRRWPHARFQWSCGSSSDEGFLRLM